MKTSNKVLIGLLTTIFLTINAVFIDIRVFGVHRDERVTPTFEQTFRLENFTNLKFVNMTRNQRKPTLEIFRSDSSYIRFVAFRDKITYQFSHGISGDTLEINSTKNMEYMYKLELHLANDLNSITLFGANMRFDGIKQGKIKAFLENSKLYSSGTSNEAASSFEIIEANLKNSKINFYNTSVDTLRIAMRSSQARIDKVIDRVEATLHNQSTLSVKNLPDIQLQKDSSSKLEIY
jgi:hypothetical protein